MLANILSSLRDTGLLPWAAAFLVVVVASVLMSRSSGGPCGFVQSPA